MIKESYFEYQIKTLATEITPSEEALSRLRNLSPNLKRTKAGKRIFMVNVVSIILCVFFTPAIALAAYNVSTSLYEKVINANLSQSEMEQLDSRLHEQGFSDENISDLNELNVNQYGQTYGPDALGADLIEVVADDGQIGYIYRNDMEEFQAQSLEDALKYSEEVVTLTVYEKDGKTKISTFTLTDGK